jgi:hypothetical protein
MNLKEVLVLIMLINLFLIGISIVSATEIIINDNGITINGTYSDTGWTLATGQGFGNDVHYTSAGDGSQKAWWCPNITITGNYSTYVSWTTHPNRATNAPYTIYYNSSSYSFTVNQENYANGSTGGSSGEWSDWYYAGNFPYTAGTNCIDRNITLNNSADGYVIADAVKFVISCQSNETNCNDGIDNDCDGLIDCQDSDCVNANAIGPGGKECCLTVSDCPGSDNSCKQCLSNECNPFSNSQLCNSSYLCSNSVGGDNTYGLSDFKAPRQGYCDGAGSCDYTLSSGPICNLAKNPNQEGTGLYFCQDGVSWCRDTCADLIDNDGDGLTDATDPDCGGLDIIPPVSIINSPAVGSWQNVDFPVNVSDSDNGILAYCEYRVWSYNGSWVMTRGWTNRTCNSPTSMIVTVGLGKDCRDLGNNTCEVHVRAVDNASNIGNTDYRKFSIEWLVPSIVDLTPKNNICINNSKPEISARYYDILTGINQTSVKIYVNSFDVTGSAIITSSKVSYTPTTNLPDGINNVTVIVNDNLGNSANKSWSFIVDTTKPVVIINSPINFTVYSNRMIDLNIFVNDTNAIKIEYSYDGIRFTPLCGLCNSYNRKMTFRDGNITLYIKAIDCAGNVGLAKVNFYVDTKPPKILKQYPLCRTCCDSSYTCTCKAPCSNGTFTVFYTEDNLKNITLFYKEILDADYKELTNTTCKSGKNQQCNFYVNLSNYDDGQYINYYFVIRDYVSETKTKICTVKVDSKLPNITITSPMNGTTYNSSKVLLNISVSKPVKLEYSDRGCEFRKLCDNCDSYHALLPLKDGLHELQIRATDCSGNSVITTRVFTVKNKKLCFSFLGCK